MKFAILSDIHSNIFALQAVVPELYQAGVGRIVILGDIYGYYPWAVECTEILEQLRQNFQIDAILGNHDALVLMESVPPEDQHMNNAAQHNRENLLARAPHCLQWLKTLPIEKRFKAGLWNISCFHGTPHDPMGGRYYPNNLEQLHWLPLESELILLGQTHYPLVRHFSTGGVIFNPGSVGQPRDGDSRASWGIIDVQNNLFEIHRTNYDLRQAIELLQQINWHPPFISALNKRKVLQSSVDIPKVKIEK